MISNHSKLEQEHHDGSMASRDSGTLCSVPVKVNAGSHVIVRRLMSVPRQLNDLLQLLDSEV